MIAAPGSPQGGSFLCHSQEGCVPEIAPSPHQSWKKENNENQQIPLISKLFVIVFVSLFGNSPESTSKLEKGE